MLKKSLKLCLLCLSLSALASPRTIPLEITIEGTGTIGHDKKFESLGRSMVLDANTLLRPWGGYAKLFKEFNDTYPTSNPEIWQKSIRFQHYLEQNYGAVAPTEILAMQIGMDGILSSQSDLEVAPILNTLGRNLTFEQKIAFGSQMGGVLVEGYDQIRAEGGSSQGGVVSLRDMINARRDGINSGVCRDITVAVAQTLTGMGVKDTFIVTFMTPTSGHATVLAQDPDNNAKTYTINYDYVTSNESASSGTHLLQNSDVVDTGIHYDIYSADGKPLTFLPSSLGTILKEFAGGNVTDYDPMARSENSVLTAVIAQKRGFDIRGGYGTTPNGDKVMALTAGYTLESERYPGRYAIVMYANERNTNLGLTEQKGVYLTANQKIYSKPWTLYTKGGGQVRSRVMGQVDLNLQIMPYTQRGTGENYVLHHSNGSYTAGAEVDYASGDGKTRVSGSATTTASIGQGDVRDERSGMTPYMRDVTVAVMASHELIEGFQGFIRASLTMRQRELGAQARTEAGLKYRWGNNNEMELVMGREGSVSGPTLAFVPGSVERYYAELTTTFQKRYKASAGVYCSPSTGDCAIRGGGAFILPLGWERKVFGLN